MAFSRNGAEMPKTVSKIDTNSLYLEVTFCI